MEHLFTREQMLHGFGNKKLFCGPVSDFNLLLDCCHIAPQGIADVLGARPNPNEQDDLRRLNISANLQAGFRAIAGNALEDELRLIPYEPGYKPDSGEVCWIDLQQAPEIREIVQRVLNFQALVLYEQDDDFIGSLVYYALFARVATQRGTVFFRKTSEKLVLGRGAAFAVVFRRGHYDTMEETVFLFDRNIDCWSDGRYMFIANVGNFERMFHYVEP